jgi:hypothetical protein
VLRTRPPLGIAPPLDLHVLGTPPTFVLSQDQTRQLNPARWLSPSALASSLSNIFVYPLKPPGFSRLSLSSSFQRTSPTFSALFSEAASGRERRSSNLPDRVNRFLPPVVAFLDHPADLGLGRPAFSHSTSLFRRGSIALILALAAASGALYCASKRSASAALVPVSSA